MKIIECRNCGADASHALAARCLECGIENLPILETADWYLLHEVVYQILGPAPPSAAKQAMVKALHQLADELER